MEDECTDGLSSPRADRATVGDSTAVDVAVTLEQLWHRVPGGTARAALGVAEALAERRPGDGAPVHQIGVAARHAEPPPDPWGPPVAVRHLPLPRPLLYEAWHGLRRPAVQRATGPVDVIHATGVAVPPRTAPLVVTVHDLAVLHDPSHFTRHGVRFLRRAIELTRRDADLVLCSSRATLEDCVAHGFDADRLRHVPLGVRAEPTPAAAVERARAAYGLAGRYVLFVGTVEPRKNLVALLDAFSRLVGRDDLDDVALALVGPAGWGEALGPRVAALGHRVRSIGFVPDDELGALYTGAAVFCYPSVLEGFGLPVLEAMARGTPVVTSARSATAELVAGGAGLAVDPRDPAAIAEALATVLTSPAVAAGLTAAGRARAASYTWARTAELTAAAYDEAAGR